MCVCVCSLDMSVCLCRVKLLDSSLKLGGGDVNSSSCYIYLVFLCFEGVGLWVAPREMCGIDMNYSSFKRDFSVCDGNGRNGTTHIKHKQQKQC